MPQLSELRQSQRSTNTQGFFGDPHQGALGEELLVVDERSRLSRSGLVEEKLIRLTEHAMKILSSSASRLSAS